MTFRKLLATPFFFLFILLFLLSVGCLALAKKIVGRGQAAQMLADLVDGFFKVMDEVASK